MFRRHPSKKALRRWFEGEENAAIDKHLLTCKRCAAIIESFAEEEEFVLPLAMSEAFDPPIDLAERLEKDVAVRLQSKYIFTAATDLFGAAIETTKILTSEESA